jgi:caffeoyl-CoA O-methyltransferase
VGKMDTLVGIPLELYALEHTTAPPDILERLEHETREAMPSSQQMLSGRTEGQFLRLLVEILGARRVLEVGMFTGYSALMMASALPDDGELHTCELDPVAEAIARRYFEESEDGAKIRVHMGAALDTISTLEGPFDFAFVDADKPNYPNYYEPVFERTRRGGVIAFDNALWKGDVVDPKDASGRAIHELNERVQADPRVDNVMTTIRDGILLVRKLRD